MGLRAGYNRLDACVADSSTVCFKAIDVTLSGAQIAALHVVASHLHPFFQLPGAQQAKIGGFKIHGVHSITIKALDPGSLKMAALGGNHSIEPEKTFKIKQLICVLTFFSTS